MRKTNTSPKRRRIEVDESPLSPAEENALADLNAMHSLPRAIKLLIRAYLNTAVYEALRAERQLNNKPNGAGPMHAARKKAG
jgi:hypothetical protein